MVDTPVKLPTIRIRPDSPRSVKWVKLFGTLSGVPVRSARPEHRSDGSREIAVYHLDNSRLSAAQRERLVEFYVNVIGFAQIDAADLVNNGLIPIDADGCEVEA